MADDPPLKNFELNSLLTKKSILLKKHSDPDINFFNNDLIKNINPLYYNVNSKNIIEGMESDSFSILHVNIRSLQKNFDSLKQFLYKVNMNFQIICLSETWCDDKNIENNYNFHLPNYKVIHQIRTSGKVGGGLCIFIKNSLLYKVKSDLSSTTNDYESLCIELVNKTSKNIIIHALYRPPSGSIKVFEDHIRNVIKNNYIKKKTVYMVGDLNLNILDYDSNKNIKQFFNVIFKNSYIPVINKPTRITNKSETSIDQIITNDFINIKIKTGIFKTDISDHFPIIIVVQKYNKSDCQKNKKIKTRIINDSSVNHFHDLLSSVKWNDLLLNLNADKAYDIFISEYYKYYNKAFPEITKLVKSKTLSNPWITKDQLKKHSNDPQGTWRIINEVIGKNNPERNNFPKILKFKDNYVIEKELVAEALNKFFINIGPSLASKIESSKINFDAYLVSNKTNIMPNDNLTEEELLCAVSSIKPKKSIGVDNISGNIIINSIKLITIPLLCIFNLSLKEGVFPEKIKIARVVLIFKSGDPSDVTNYRPISVLTCISKVLERIMYNRLYSFLIQNNILYNKQFGFKSGHSTDHAILHLVHDIFKGFNEKKYTLGVFIDLSKAFDTVDHLILLSKLEFYGIKNSNLAWFKSYLSNRKQYISYDGDKTDNMIITCGVPQGSVLGSLLFLIYVNDLYKFSNILNTTLFADDTNLFYSHEDINILFLTVNKELDNLTQWFKANKLSLNITKTKYTLFHRVHKKENIPLKLPNLFIDKNIIKREISSKFLGVILDENVTWREHISVVENKVSKNIGILYKAKQVLNQSCLKYIYFSFIHANTF
ncbi:uncharacterized protein LOC136086066 [Hydra vulgaris]|uniref:Uncharacterized protein LOC136086066 n=1 Tax=Hydra vulgaris TaxID=6087 RepID=A0ABM4CRB1_HYDVU